MSVLSPFAVGDKRRIAQAFECLCGCFCICRCLLCPPLSFCLHGVAAASGLCPESGYDCVAGKLRLRSGYWSPVDVSTSGNVSALAITAFACVNADACVGDTGGLSTARCADGYAGQLCVMCADGWAGLSGFCTKCYSPGLAGIGIALLLVTVTSLMSLTVALSLEERSVSRVRAWRCHPLVVALAPACGCPR